MSKHENINIIPISCTRYFFFTRRWNSCVCPNLQNKSYSTVNKLSLSSWLLTLLVAIDFYYCCIAMHLYSPYFRPIQSTMPSTCQSHGEGLMVLIQFERNQDWGRHRNNLLLVSPLSLLIRFGVKQGGDCPSQDGRGQLQIWAQDRLQIMFYHFFTSNTSLVWLF